MSPAMKRVAAAVLMLLIWTTTDTLAGTLDDAPLSVGEMQRHVMAPRIYAVNAYVVHTYDKCPPCPPNAVCETCQLGIVIADAPDTPVREGLYLSTPQAARFLVGSKYIFRIRYRIERNAAGARQLEGPQMIDYLPGEPK